MTSFATHEGMVWKKTTQPFVAEARLGPGPGSPAAGLLSQVRLLWAVLKCPVHGYLRDVQETALSAL